MEHFGMGISPLDVIELEQQDSLIRRVVAAERDAEFATNRAATWIDEAARLREQITRLDRRTEVLRDQRNIALVLLVVAVVVAAVRG